MLDELDGARAQYAPPLDLDVSPVDTTSQRPLPFADLFRVGSESERRTGV
jgi:hypothetical protein